MTGKDLILFILNNDLLDEVILEDGALVGFMNEEEAAVKFGVGVATVKVWCNLGMVKCIKIDDTFYILKNTTVYPIEKQGGEHNA